MLPILHGQTILVYTDCVVAVAYKWQEVGTSSLPLFMEAWQLLLWCQDHAILLVPNFILGHLHVFVDLPSQSHQVLSME